MLLKTLKLQTKVFAKENRVDVTNTLSDYVCIQKNIYSKEEQKVEEKTDV